MLGIRTRCRRMVGTGGTIKLWFPCCSCDVISVVTSDVIFSWAFQPTAGQVFQPRLIVKTRGQTWLFWCKLPSKISRTCARTTTGDVTPYTTQPMTSSRRTAHDNCSKGLFRLFSTSTSYYFTTCRYLPTHLLMQTNANVGIVRKGVGESEKGESVNENEREVRERNVE